MFNTLTYSATLAISSSGTRVLRVLRRPVNAYTSIPTRKRRMIFSNTTLVIRVLESEVSDVSAIVLVFESTGSR
jgi:hypothetical protein